VGKPEGNRGLGRARCKWEDNVKMNLRRIDWIDLVQDRGQLRALGNMVINFRVS
jgi:hypothetical protein